MIKNIGMILINFVRQAYIDIFRKIIFVALNCMRINGTVENARYIRISDVA